MKKTILLLFCSISAFLICAQQDSVFIRRSPDRFAESLVYETDTILLDNSFSQILYGTMILPGRTKCLNTHYEYGYGLDTVFNLPCSMNVRPEEVIEINQIIFSDSSLNIQCKIAENCCYDFLCEVEVVEDSILNLEYISYGSLCACFCCFNLNYSFSIDKNKEKFHLVKYVMINEDRKTLKNLF